MKSKTIATTAKHWSMILFCVVTASAVASCSEGRTAIIDFELTGTVRDSATKLPLEGAYVVASYRKAEGGPAAVTSWCVKTRGMYTAEDGKFHFPVERLDGWSPAGLSAIKPDYFRGSVKEPDPAEWKKQTAKAYTDRDLYLKKQDPGHLDFRFGYGDEYCNAATREDAAAGVEFMKIGQSEKAKYGVSQEHLDAGWKLIRRLETLPSAASPSTKERPRRRQGQETSK